MLSARAYDTHVEQLFDRVQKLHQILSVAGISYRIVGGLAVFLHVAERDPIRARLTADVNAAIRREDLDGVIEAAESAGWEYRHVAGMDMLVEAHKPKARSAVHLVFVNEKVRPSTLDRCPNPLRQSLPTESRSRP